MELMEALLLIIKSYERTKILSFDIIGVDF